MMNNSTYHFPSDFRWGTATSAYQVEGNLTNTDWHQAEQQGGYVFENHTAGIACDWWNRAEEDFDRMADLGIRAHRLSVEWSRIEPEPGRWDWDALDRYREMLKALIARGIKPMVTLHHFTNPLWLADRGAWLNPASVGWFERYTRAVVTALGDLADLWCTINEPSVLTSQAYITGRWPPGIKSLDSMLSAAVHLAQAHAAAYYTIHSLVPSAQVGMAHHMIVWRAARPWLPMDVFASHTIGEVFNWLAPNLVVEGLIKAPGRLMRRLPGLARTLDWLGLNYYQRYRVRLNLFRPQQVKTSSGMVELTTSPDHPSGPPGWGEFYARGLYETIQSLWRRYRLPIYITENGVPDPTDAVRPGFILSHLKEAWQAIQSGIPVRGYYHWSLLDNFEWTEGYDPRFRLGLIEVDFATQARHIRPSGRMYGAICRAGGILPALVEQYT